LIITGEIKRFETTFLDYVPDVSKIEQFLIKKTDVVSTFREKRPVPSPMSGDYIPMAEDLGSLLDEVDTVSVEQ